MKHRFLLVAVVALLATLFGATGEVAAEAGTRLSGTGQVIAGPDGTFFVVGGGEPDPVAFPAPNAPIAVDRDRGGVGQADPRCKAARDAACGRQQACPVEAYAIDPLTGATIPDGATDSLRWAIGVANATTCDVVLVHGGEHLITDPAAMFVIDDLLLVGAALTQLPDPAVIVRESSRPVLIANAPLKIWDLSFDGGSASAGGILHGVCQCEFEILRSAFRNGHATNLGGAVRAVQGSSLRIDSSVFAGNTTDGSGSAVAAAGALEVIASEFFANARLGPPTVADGPVIAAYSDLSGEPVSIQDSTFTSNVSMAGKAIGVDGDREVTISGSTFTANSSIVDPLTSYLLGGTVSISGGVELSLLDSTFAGNNGTYGTLSLINGATATVDGISSIGNVAQGAIIQFFSAGGLVVRDSTIVNIDGGTGVASIVLQSPQSLVDHVTIVSASRPAIAAQASVSDAEIRHSYLGSDVGACVIPAATSLAHNYATDDSCGNAGWNGSQVGPALSFDPLTTSSGGAGPSMAPSDGSPLVDAIPLAECTNLDDQRHRLRPFGNACDIGAVERHRPVQGHGGAGG